MQICVIISMGIIWEFVFKALWGDDTEMCRGARGGVLSSGPCAYFGSDVDIDIYL
jgi:hypothetical protein